MTLNLKIILCFVLVLSGGLLLMFTGCRGMAYQTEPAVSLDTVQKLPLRIAELHPGMSSKEVWDHLGLPSGKFGALGSGPLENYREEYVLPHCDSLTLVFDLSKGDFSKPIGGSFLYGSFLMNWEARATEVTIGMTRAEVDKILPEASNHPDTAPRMSWLNGVGTATSYWVAEGWLVTVQYDSTGGKYSTSNRVTAPVALVRQSWGDAMQPIKP